MEVTKEKYNLVKEKPKTKQPGSLSEAWRDLKASPRELFLMFLLKFLESYSYFAIIYTLIIFLSDEFKYTDEQAGWAYGLFGMCTSVYGFIFGGFVIDNLGVRLSLCLGCSILLFGRLLLVVCTQHFYIVMILYTILPIGTCLGIPVLQIGIRRFTSEKARSLAFSIFYAMMNISAIFSASAIDFFRKYVADKKIEIYNGYSFDITAYRALFLSGACTTLISLFVSFFFIRDIEDYESEEEKANREEEENIKNNIYNKLVNKNEDEESCQLLKINNSNSHSNLNMSHNVSNRDIVNKKKIIGPFEVIKDVTSQKSFWKFVYAIILLMGVRIVFRHLDATFPKYMIREFGKDVMYGSIIAINPFLIVILIPVFAPLSYQFSAFAQITLGAFITSLSPFFLVYGPYLWSSIMFVVILSIGEALWSPRLYEYTIFITEKGREGIYMALASSPMFVATLVTGASSGILLDNYCPENGPKESWKMWLIIGLITFSSPILLFVFKNKIEITQEELDKERADKAELKRLGEEKEKEKFKESLKLNKKFEDKDLMISSHIDINYQVYSMQKQEEFSLKNIK